MEKENEMMKKTIMKRILALTMVFLMIISTPFYISENINNSPYVYAEATFTQTLESELFKKTLIPTLISAGLVFTNKESIEKVADDTIEWLKQQGFDWKPPDEPDGPNLEDVIKEMLKAVTLVSASNELVKGIVKIPKMLWNLIKYFVDENYNVGTNNITDTEITISFGDLSITGKPAFMNNYRGVNFTWDNNGSTGSYHAGYFHSSINITQFDLIDFSYYNVNASNQLTVFLNYSYIKNGVLYYDSAYPTFTIPGCYYIIKNNNEEKTVTDGQSVVGVNNIVDNQNYDWNNKYTDSKVIPIPIEKDPYGDPKKDENGYYLPSIDTEEWIDVQPTEIPNLDISGTPIPDIPTFPDIENPDDDEQTGIMVYIGNILQIIVGQLSKIVEGVKTIVSNTNQLVFNTPNPVFDPITGEQIDPETGQPVEPEPVGEVGDGIIGNGIDTNIPTDFEWGSFRHFLDIFFIFIYFIVILILIILKFLQIVFVGIPNISANTDLFTQYPSILEGVNYVKNLKVGGLSITVHQAFEFVFLIFFYIFIIKQIRKLYNAHVYEESAENPRIAKDMKMDYYENIKSNRWSDDK
jgi:hypothetical protein